MRWFAYAMASSACAATTAIAMLLTGYLDLVNTVMLFLMTVFLIAVGLGRGPAVMSSFLSVALFDFFFVPPALSFAVTETQDLLTLAVMLVVALITAHLTAGLSEQAHAARLKEERTRAFYRMARELVGATAVRQVVAIMQRFLRIALGGESVFFVKSEGRGFVAVGRPQRHLQGAHLIHITAEDLDVRQLVETAGSTGEYAMFDGIGYFPVKTSRRVRGVLAVTFGRDVEELNEHRELIDAVASLVAAIIGRLQLRPSESPARP